MTFLVTGVAGFIGARTAQVLIDRGETVVGIDNVNDYYDVKLKRLRLKFLSENKNFSFVELDIEDAGQLTKLFEENDFKGVFNLAGRAGVRASLDLPIEYLDTNTKGTINLLELCQKHGIKNFVTASSSSVYSNVETPFREDQQVDTPISPYAASKRAAELIAHTYAFQYGMNVSALRFFTVYGPFGRPDMSVLRFIRWINDEKPIQLFGTGKQARDFTYIDDIVEGIIAAENKNKGFEVFNLGGGNNPISMFTLIEEIGRQLNKTPKIDFLPSHNADVEVTWADISKANEHLDWAPKVDLSTGISKTIKWYLAHKKELDDIKF